jgi:Ca2+-binding RTX toxin-like protein
MQDSIKRRRRGLTGVALVATMTALATGGSAQAAVKVYPGGGATFDADAEGWTVANEVCSKLGGVSVTCSADGSFKATGGDPGGALATDVTVTANVLGLFGGGATWTSPSFSIPEGADVTDATLSYAASLVPGGLLNLDPETTIAPKLVDVTEPGSATLQSATLDSTDTGFSSVTVPVPAEELIGGHTYRLAFDTDTGNGSGVLSLLGTASTLLDNVGLSVTTSGGGTGGGGGGGGTGGTGGTGGGGGTTTTRRSSLSSRALLALLRTLDLRALTGSYAGGSLVPPSRCTILGTPGPDRLVGTRGNDVICGRGGRDVIRGGGGRDLIDGGAGNDQLRGGPGRDVLLGLAGRDRLRGGAGRDLLAGGAGRDRGFAQLRLDTLRSIERVR